MAKWRINYNGNTPAANYPDQTTLNALGVVAGVYEDGFPVIITDPNDPNDDWDTFIGYEFTVPQGVVYLCADALPDVPLNGWGAAYAWDLNGGV